MLKKIFPLIIFTLFFMTVMGSLLFYAPGWGLMDDCRHLNHVELIWSGGNFFGNLWQLISIYTNVGEFIPVYFTWAALAYHIFRNAPLSLYLGIAVFNLMTLLLWGYTLNKVCPDTEKNRYMNIFLYPLTFSIFTPFWNNFMYISTQQKFIIFFSAIAVYLFYLACAKERKIYFIFSTIAVLLGVLTHPEGIFLNLAMLLLSLVLLLIIRKKIYIFSFVINFILFFAYLFFTFTIQLKGSYASGYGNNLNLEKLVFNFLAAPALIKIITFSAALYLCFLIITIIKGKNRFSPVFLIFPLSYMSFVAVLVPWGYPNYHLSVLSPFIMGMLFPVYSFLNSRSLSSKILVNSFLIIIVFVLLFTIWFPRISKISDIKKVEQFIVDLEKKGDSNVYFMAQPCMEACDSLGSFTKTKTIYLNDSLLSGEKLIKSSNNLMIFRDECPKVYFDGVQESKEIYRNDTWRIFQVEKKAGVKKEFEVYFSENIIEKIKTFLKG